MNEDIDGGIETTVPTWAVFGDLMSAALGAFVLILVGVVGLQLQLSAKLDEEVKQRQAETQRRQTLEQALAVPLATGRITLVNGRIGISGNVLFALNSDQLQPEGRDVLKSLAQPLSDYLRTHDEILMVSGFTDNQQVRGNNRGFADNWELSAQRALTVTRALIDEGLPPESVFAAAFGAEHPVASNADADGRAKNRRVEIAPVPRQAGQERPGGAPRPGTATPATSAAPGAGGE
ncbi:OmpA-like domain-containing protein [Bordetella sputigena]|uniref:OmpA family protein n=1 Tax=Bordetella sputigena TaxID=1416810 RepID=UPI0039F02355